jgi:hypothetical protein
MGTACWIGRSSTIISCVVASWDDAVERCEAIEAGGWLAVEWQSQLRHSARGRSVQRRSDVRPVREGDVCVRSAEVKGEGLGQ